MFLAVAPCAVALCTVASTTNAQPQVPVETGVALAGGFTEVSAWITKSAALVPADKYTYKPVGTVRSYGELVGHIVDGYNYYCGMAAGKNPKWSDAAAQGKTDKTTLAAKLTQATAACTAVYGPKKTAPPLMSNIAHSNLHYGNMITYIRMLGLVPPSS